MLLWYLTENHPKLLQPCDGDFPRAPNARLAALPCSCQGHKSPPTQDNCTAHLDLTTAHPSCGYLGKREFLQHFPPHPHPPHKCQVCYFISTTSVSTTPYLQHPMNKQDGTLWADLFTKHTGISRICSQTGQEVSSRRPRDCSSGVTVCRVLSISWVTVNGI